VITILIKLAMSALLHVRWQTTLSILSGGVAGGVVLKAWGMETAKAAEIS
jgi:hypothetical protein